MTWLDDYKRAKSGQQQGYQPAPQYQPPTYQGQPVYQQPPTPPAYAPFGFDTTTGLPIAPYGRDQTGAIITQPPYQPGYDQRGYPQPQGYGQPPYGYPQGQQPPPGWHPQEYDPNPLPQDPNAKIPYMQAAAHWRGTKKVQEAVHSGACENCGGDLYDRSAGPVVRGQGGAFSGAGPTVTNLTTGVRAGVAPICGTCGYNGMWLQSGQEDLGGLATVVTGEARRAPGAKSGAQVEHQHGLVNLFAHDRKRA